MRTSNRYLQLPASNRSRLDAVGPRLIEAAGATTDPDVTLSRGLSFLENIARRGAYLALLQQYPMALRRVADMICASTWGTEYLNLHPLLLDELLDPRLYEIATDWKGFREQLQRNLADHAGDTEREMAGLRTAAAGAVMLDGEDAALLAPRHAALRRAWLGQFQNDPFGSTLTNLMIAEACIW